MIGLNNISLDIILIYEDKDFEIIEDSII